MGEGVAVWVTLCVVVTVSVLTEVDTMVSTEVTGGKRERERDRSIKDQRK